MKKVSHLAQEKLEESKLKYADKLEFARI